MRFISDHRSGNHDWKTKRTHWDIVGPQYENRIKRVRNKEYSYDPSDGSWLFVSVDEMILDFIDEEVCHKFLKGEDVRIAPEALPEIIEGLRKVERAVRGKVKKEYYDNLIRFLNFVEDCYKNKAGFHKW